MKVVAVVVGQITVMAVAVAADAVTAAAAVVTTMMIVIETIGIMRVGWGSSARCGTTAEPMKHVIIFYIIVINVYIDGTTVSPHNL